MHTCLWKRLGVVPQVLSTLKKYTFICMCAHLSAWVCTRGQKRGRSSWPRLWTVVNNHVHSQNLGPLKEYVFLTVSRSHLFFCLFWRPVLSPACSLLIWLGWLVLEPQWSSCPHLPNSGVTSTHHPPHPTQHLHVGSKCKPRPSLQGKQAPLSTEPFP